MKTDNYDKLIILLIIIIIIMGGTIAFRQYSKKTKLDATCVATINSNKTEIIVNSNDKIDKYIYNDEFTSGTNSYIVNKKVDNNQVIVIKGNNQKTITCDNKYVIDAKCEATINDFSTEIVVNTDSTIDKYIYNNKYESVNKKYIIGERKNDNKVTLVSGDIKSEITCEDKVIINGTCSAKVDNNKTIIEVNASTPIDKYLYNDKYESNNNTYTINEVLSDNKVTLTSLGVKKEIKCDSNVKINATCKASIKADQTVIVVNNDNNYNKYIYNDQYESINNTYTIPNKSSNNKVKVFLGENSKEIICTNELVNTNLEIHFFNSGHYDDAILIRTDDKTLFIDGGRYSCKDKVLSYLKEAGVKTIDLLIGSHVEFDHIQVQGLIIDNFNVLETLYSVDIKTCATKKTCEVNDQKYTLDAINRHNTKVTVAKVPSVMKIGDIELYIIGPQSITSNKNNNSLIFILKYYNNTFMFTGDSYASFMNVSELNNKAKQLGLSSIDVDVLKYPHHGNSPMNNKVLNAIKPEFVVVPNANASKYPSTDNINVVKNFGAKMYRVSDGNILLKSDGNNINVKTGVKASDYKR